MPLSQPMNKQPHGTPFLTIGMATVDDFDGVYFTITSLMIHHADVMQRCEFVVVDNQPKSKQGRLVKQWMRRDVPNGRYIAFDGPAGTAPPRNEVFKRARAAAVLCLDCHVLLTPGSVEKLIDYYREHPNCPDLLSGPLITDSGRLSATHQEPTWRDGAWGVWAIDERGVDPGGEPFEIWQQGMGLFSCRKDAWVGFHPKFRGFGGCESYVMEKFRRRGGRVLCCPWLRWSHRFPRVRGTPYAVHNQDRLRNYLIGFRELGIDPQPALEHFGVAGVAESRKPPRVRAAAEIAVVGSESFGGVRMRGRLLAEHLACKLIAPQGVERMARRDTIIAVKGGFCPKTVRARCDRLIFDPLDVFAGSNSHSDPASYWRSAYKQLRFDDILATSPACYDVMRGALPASVAVHLVPHASDSTIEPDWRRPDGPVVYTGLRRFVDSGIDRIRQACRLIGKELTIGKDCDALQGAALALALRLPPYDTELNRYCKPQIKLANAAAAGLPAVSTDCPAALSLYPEMPSVPVNFSARQLAEAMQQSLAGPGLPRVFYERDYLAAMDRLLRRDSVVIYTAIFGDYDELLDPQERLPDADYVCFTDNPRLRSDVWRIRYCKPIGDPSRQAKRIKILAHEALDCAVSLWIDGRIELRSIHGALERMTADIGLLRHPLRNCIYDEATHCKNTGRGNPERIEESVHRYRAEGHPEGNGLWLGGIVLRRHTAATRTFNLEWWREVKRGTSRDQISLPVVLRRLGMPFDTLPNDMLRHEVYRHARRRFKRS
jgi:hypothetical protein